MRLADGFRADAPGELADGDFELSCTCGLMQRVGAMEIDADEQLTLYDCARCATRLIGIMRDDVATGLWVATSTMTRRQQAGGHERNGYVVGSRVDVALRPAQADRDRLLIPATPNFFEALPNL